MTSDSLDFKIFHHTSEVDPESWNQLSAGRPFTSHQWYRYGETVMSDCLPTYFIVYDQDQPIARATFWRMNNDPPAIQSKIVRECLQAVLRRWPLFICRSPLSGTTGLILPEGQLRVEALAILSTKSSELLRKIGGSFLVIDYLKKEECESWPEKFVPVNMSGPGTAMQINWPSFEAYLDAGNKKDRQHYKKTVREAEKMGIQIKRNSRVDRTEEALTLIRSVEHRFGSTENPWAPAMLNYFDMLPGATFLTATIENRLVGCGLVLEDNGTQMNAILGLAENVPYVYFMLVYESLKIAFDHHIHLMRMGSGAYDVKKQLGFSLEDNNHLLFSASNSFLQKTGSWLAKL